MHRALLSIAASFLCAPGAAAQSAEDQVDVLLDVLRTRQEADGSYGDLQTTARAILAYRNAPRRYGEADGPFLRKAVEWLAAKVAPLPEGGASLAWVDALAADAAFQSLDSTTARKAREDLAAVLAERPGTPLPEAQEKALREWRVPEGQDARALLEDLVRAPGRSRFGRLVPPAAQLAKEEPDATLSPGVTAPPVPWANALCDAVLEAAADPAALEEWSTAELADAARVLSICSAHVVEGEGGSVPDLAQEGTLRGQVKDIEAAYREAARSALQFLESQQDGNGHFQFMGREEAGVSALALSAAVRTADRLGIERPAWVDPGLDWLVSLQKEDGSIHSGILKVYTTSATVMALVDGGREKDADAIRRAAEYLEVVQSDEGEGYDRDSDWAYGGIDYGDDLRPDLSNTQFGLEALHAAGVPADHDAFERALAFLERCQNSPEVNTMVVERGDGKIVEAGTDGGAMYYPGESKAGLAELPGGRYVARSYGSMTYALLKCYLFAGLPLEDPRVQAALHWIQENYTLEYNPGFEHVNRPGAQYQGLYYYYFTLAKALDASGLEALTTPDGQRHPWRRELVEHLLRIGFAEGYWSNTNSPRWWEELPALATSYALIALDTALPVE